MKVALLPGDGIGPEIVAEAVKVLKGLDEPFEFEEAPFGGAGYEASGHPLPEATLALAQQADAVIVGATGVWKYDKLERAFAPRAGHSRLAQGAEAIRESAPGGLV
jgi:3-isopropylmalate dehydrogenase